jgi:predicted MPP superfamily phosphohydrolase
MVAVGAAGLLYGNLIGRNHLRVHKITLTLPDLPAAFDGYRVVQLSDFHIGGRGWSAPLMRRAAALAMAQAGDLLVLTGDFFETTPSIQISPELFGGLQARDGVLAVLGNHDYADHGVRVRRIVDALQDQGIRVLRNESHRLRRGDRELWIVGVDDPYSGHDNLPRAMQGIPTTARPIMLTHYPDFTWNLPPHRFAAVLCGHTHGSQIRLPLIAQYARYNIANTRFSHGLYDVNGIPVFVNTGVGTSGRPIRVLARPEVAVIQLRAASSGPGA